MARLGIHRTPKEQMAQGHRAPFKLDELWSVLRDFGHVAGVIVGLWALGMQLVLTGGIDMANLRNAASVSFNASAPVTDTPVNAATAIEIICATPRSETTTILEECGDSAALTIKSTEQSLRREAVRNLFAGPQD